MKSTPRLFSAAFFRGGPRKIVLFAALCSLAAAAFYYWENETIRVETFVCESAKIPRSFDGFKIVQISDLHDKEFGRENRRLFAKIRAAKPDAIAITGDLTNDPILDLEFAANFVERAAKIAPVYYVSGNHEALADPPSQYDALTETLEANGANVLHCETTELTRGDESIVLAGIDDPARFKSRPWRSDAAIVQEKLAELAPPRDRFAILLAHRPELPGLYSNAGFDLSLTGHAHGGQVVIPFIGGLYAPNQGVFPTYANGAYRVGKTLEIVSNGLGASAFPTRIFNRPSLVVCELKSLR